jgi:hypothetical protein
MYIPKKIKTFSSEHNSYQVLTSAKGAAVLQLMLC